MNIPLVAFIVVLLGTALFFDLKSHRIPNMLVGMSLVLALPLQVAVNGTGGVVQFSGGGLTAFVLLLPLYVLGGTSAGDVKLMGAVGALLGPKLAVQAVIATLIFGAAVALLHIVFSKHARLFFARYGDMVSTLFRTGHFVYLPRTEQDPGSKRFAYATAIVLGTAWVLSNELQLWSQS